MIVFIGFCSAPLFSLEGAASFRLENMAFAADRAKTESDFAGSLLWGASLHVEREVLENISLGAGFSSEAITGNMLYTLLHYSEGVMDLGVGPFIGFFNSLTAPFQSGLSTRVRIDVPRIIFFSINGDNSIGGKLIQAGDYIQERNEVSLGSYIGKMSLSLAVLSKRYTSRNTDGIDVTDSSVEYAFRTVFAHMEYFRLMVSLAYRTIGKTYAGSTSTVKHTLSAPILEAQLETSIFDYLVLVSSFESTPYLFGQDYLEGFSQLIPFGYLMRVSLGLSIDFDRLFEG